MTEKYIFFQCIIKHLISSHRNNGLKYREIELNEVSGSVTYNTNAHVDIIPADGDIVVTADNNVGIYIVPTGLCFRAEIRKIMYTSVNPTFPYIRWV